MADEEQTSPEQQKPEEHAISSSVISQVTINPDGSCIIQFVSGGEAIYESIPRDIIDTLLSAPSAGAYFNSEIRGKFQ